MKSHELYNSDSPAPPPKRQKRLPIRHGHEHEAPAPTPAVALAPPPPPGMLTCPECGKFYKNANSLRVHKLKYHRHDFIQ